MNNENFRMYADEFGYLFQFGTCRAKPVVSLSGHHDSSIYLLVLVPLLIQKIVLYSFSDHIANELN